MEAASLGVILDSSVVIEAERHHLNVAQLLKREGLETWQQRRARAASARSNNHPLPCYDAVVVDEAQDVGVPELRLLAAIAPSGRLMGSCFLESLGQVLQILIQFVDG